MIFGHMLLPNTPSIEFFPASDADEAGQGSTIYEAAISHGTQVAPTLTTRVVPVDRAPTKRRRPATTATKVPC